MFFDLDMFVLFLLMFGYFVNEKYRALSLRMEKFTTFNWTIVVGVTVLAFLNFIRNV